LQSTAREISLGRPKKFGDEETKSLTVRLSASLRAHVDSSAKADDKSPTDYIIGIIELDRDLGAALEDNYQDLLMSAAAAGTEYSRAKAETLARLVRLGLAAERKFKK
jgi:hypothetical protein